ncbi:hypothetical protein CK203_029982 [Vitis vinifera]|uniref:Uncharacterized protein n=1 Tax=Vitis vinifera TaxID=29760 RepID=A0A438IK93_VITVI|nr:hypothetical protein CK203_029982 [Vitis vinifera]
MPKRMLVVSTKLVNITFLELHPDEDQASSTISGKFMFLLGVKEKSTIESRRRNYNNASLKLMDMTNEVSSHWSLGHGNPLSEHHYRGDGLMLFNCNGLIPMTYSFNGRWLAVTVTITSGQEIHADLVSREYRKVIDGENVTITNLEAKFVPKG